MPGEHDTGYSFKDVLGKELELIKDSTISGKGGMDLPSDSPPGNIEPHVIYDLAHNAQLTGLAFSGGGIRSATFNLGVLQSLAKVPKKDRDAGEVGLLSRFDYFSTVSGGGYIGSWLSAWLHRQAERRPNDPDTGKPPVVNEAFVREVQPLISTRPCDFGPQPESALDREECAKRSGFTTDPSTSGFPPLEHAAVRYLRRYTNYLTPRVGMSGDTLAVVSLFLRNFVLLQLALISLVVVVLLIPYCAAAFSALVIRSGTPGELAIPVLVAGVGVLFVALFIWRHAERFDAGDRRKKQANPRWMSLSILLVIVAFWLLVISAIRLYAEPGEIWLSAGAGDLAKEVTAIAGIGYLLAWLVGPNTLFYRRLKSRFKRIGRVVTAFVSALVYGALTYLCTLLIPGTLDEASGQILPAITFGPSLILAVLSFSIAVHLGLARHLFDAHEREWWGRLGGFVILFAAIWLIVFAAALYTPPLFTWLGNGGFALIVAWAGTSGVGAWLARSTVPESSGIGAIGKRLLMKAAPWLFIAGLALVISYAMHFVMVKVFDPQPLPVAPVGGAAAAAGITEIGLAQAGIALGVSLAVFLLLTWRLDINVFSLHSLYRNRLVRAYLGATRAGRRNYHPYTGFDMEDDMPLAGLAEQRPIHILNTTINMTGGDDLAWQTRRAASFTFTPQYVGYEAKSSQGFDIGAYRPTSEYAAGKETGPEAGLSLGTVMAISGAAASPNMGYYTSAPVAALLTAFNLRLGYWAGNPVLRKPDRASAVFSPAWRKKRSLLCARPIISELTGSATAEADWINLSDGGHFDNLGVYELVRRRCRFIVVTDAGCDPRHEFQDLANTIRKCWTDLGVHIYFPGLDQLGLQGRDERFCQVHGTFGSIEYPDRARYDAGKPETKQRYGLILYLKCSLTRSAFDKFVDIRQYASSNPAYPHQTTGDQFFDENQFEAYRHLGFCVAEQFRKEIRELFQQGKGDLDPEKVFQKARAICQRQA